MAITVKEKFFLYGSRGAAADAYVIITIRYNSRNSP